MTSPLERRFKNKSSKCWFTSHPHLLQYLLIQFIVYLITICTFICQLLSNINVPQMCLFVYFVVSDSSSASSRSHSHRIRSSEDPSTWRNFWVETHHLHRFFETWSQGGKIWNSALVFSCGQWICILRVSMTPSPRPSTSERRDVSQQQQQWRTTLLVLQKILNLSELLVIISYPLDWAGLLTADSPFSSSSSSCSVRFLLLLSVCTCRLEYELQCVESFSMDPLGRKYSWNNVEEDGRKKKRSFWYMWTWSDSSSSIFSSLSWLKYKVLVNPSSCTVCHTYMWSRLLQGSTQKLHLLFVTEIHQRWVNVDYIFTLIDVRRGDSFTLKRVLPLLLLPLPLSAPSA